MPRRLEKLRYIDLFAGCGGLSLGFQQSDLWKGIFAIEKSPDAFETLRHNLVEKKGHFDWPEWLPIKNHDIRQVLKRKLPELTELRGTVDLIAGGPPCQGFSLAGRRIEKDRRNNLVHSYLEMIEAVRPEMILFENVKGFKIGFQKKDRSRGIPFSEVVLSKLRDLGYENAEARIVDFSEFGVPQHRKRCIIVGTLTPHRQDFFERLEFHSRAFLKRNNLAQHQSLETAISDLLKSSGTVQSPDSVHFRAGVYSKGPLSAYQELMRRNAEEFPDSHRFANHSQKTEDKFQTIIDLKLSSAEIRNLFDTKKASTKLLEPADQAPTLTTLPDDYVHYCEPRILTVREYARIQSFPDWYKIRGKYTTGGDRRKVEVPRYSQIGNAIPPFFGEVAAQALFEAAVSRRKHGLEAAV